MYTLANYYNLKSGDVIITPKSAFNIVKHFIVFEGFGNDGVDYYLENKQGHGVRRIDGATFQRENTVQSIRRFSGNDNARSIIIQRAQSLIGKPYNLINFNCEHYATYAQTGTAESEQIHDWFKGAMAFLGVCVFIGLAASMVGGRRK